MKVERWEEETDKEWTERLAEEIEVADNAETTKYFFQSGYEENEIILNYIGADSWTWKEHPEGPFKASQIIEWKKKAEKWDKFGESIEKARTQDPPEWWLEWCEAEDPPKWWVEFCEKL